MIFYAFANKKRRMKKTTKIKEEEEVKCVCFMLYVILILSIDVMNVGNILVDIVPRARFFLFSLC